MKKVILSILCMCMMLTLFGCGKEEEEVFYETTLSFDKDGKIADVIVESFSEAYYSEDGLKAYFQEKISDFNSGNINSGDVTLSDLAVDNGVARATLKFDSSDAYTRFYGTPTFYGTINDAYDKGYITETVLKSVESNDTLSKIDLMGRKDDTIIIVGEVVRVHTPKKVTFTSANVEVLGEKDVRISSDSSGMAYILLK